MPNVADAADGLYPPIDAFDRRTVAVTSPHGLYVEQSGNPAGFPVIFLHGGPGSQTNPEQRRYFDPAFYRIVLFDQRGCGRSSPSGCTQSNTTWDLVNDIEKIRRTLEIDRWLLFGGSWGSTLALAYAAMHQDRVAGMILRGVFLSDRRELDWYLNGLRRFVPEAWERLTGGNPERLIERYHRDVNHPDRAFAVESARRWSEYENSVMAIGAASTAPAGVVDETAVLDRARVQLHYLAAGCFLREGQLLEDARGIRVPTIVVQGRTDMVCPPVTAFDLSRRLPNAQLRVIEQAGHSALGQRLAPALRNAADDMRKTLAVTA